MYGKEVGLANFIKFYFIPYIVCFPFTLLAYFSFWFDILQLANHWIVMLTFLHHTDPTVAHYRNKQWSFLRGAVSTVDRPLLGWAGRFFLHNVSHDHISHHLFSSIPFCKFAQFFLTSNDTLT